MKPTDDDLEVVEDKKGCNLIFSSIYFNYLVKASGSKAKTLAGKKKAVLRLISKATEDAIEVYKKEFE